MKRTISLLLACALGLSMLSGCAQASAVRELTASKLSTNPSESKEVNQALASFGLELLQKTREADKTSTLVSPLSVALALSMAANGAEGETLAQFQEVLGGGVDLVTLNGACVQLMQDYQNLGGSTKCSIANSLWVDPEGQIKDEFVGECQGIFDAQVFQGELSAPGIVDDLNGWVSKHTNKMIPKIIDQPFSEDAACLLVNALYLKNKWLREFDPQATRKGNFDTSDCATLWLDYLHCSDTRLSYLRGEGEQGVVLPYDDGRLAFFALLPDADLYAAYAEDYGIGASFYVWLDSLEGSGLTQLINSREDAMFLHFAMPKFESEWQGNLEEILPPLGLKDAFHSGTANFSAMGDNPEGYYIDQVIHAARIEVNEKGTEAAAATVVAAPAGADEPPQEGITLVLDRPFLYGIVDLDTGVPLFLGTYE